MQPDPPSAETAPAAAWPPGSTVWTASRALSRQPHLALLLKARLVPFGALAPRAAGGAGWGRNARADALIDACRARALPYLHLEDPIFRSWGLSAEVNASPPIGVAVDRTAPYYDCRGSDLERRILAAPTPPAAAQRLQDLIVGGRLTKYILPAAPVRFGDGRPVIGVVDQVMQDRSILFGGCGPEEIAALAAHAAGRAVAEQALIVLRTHPDVVSGKGFSALEQALRRACAAAGAPLLVSAEGGAPDFLDAVGSVVTLTSGLGFEALLRGLPVACFGAPFYAGYGLTNDLGARPEAVAAYRRRAPAAPPGPGERPSLLHRLLAAMLIDSTLWWDPVTREPCDAGRALSRLASWRGMDRLDGRDLVLHGVSRWKRKAVAAMAASPGQTTRSAWFSAPSAASAAAPPAGTGAATRIVWGADPARGRPGLVRAEDGFIRSVGLGAALIRPSSLVFDRTGLHLDATRPSDLETMLESGAGLTDAVLARAERLRGRIVAAGIDKYNLGRAAPAPPAGYELAVGQVIDDASVRFGLAEVAPGDALVRRVRAERPGARLVYRPHPDVIAGLRRGDAASGAADLVAGGAAISELIEGCVRLHAVTSLAGFEALLRGRPVSAYGLPFYAGWGLTDDALASPRRTRRVTLDGLVAAALILYPRYLSLRSGLRCEVEDVIDEIEAIRAGRLAGPRGRGRWSGPLLRLAGEIARKTGIRF